MYVAFMEAIFETRIYLSDNSAQKYLGQFPALLLAEALRRVKQF